jgi:DNA-binding Xre family transcriptional regulator
MAIRIHVARLLAIKAQRQNRRVIPVTEVVEALNQTKSASENKTRISRGAVDNWLAGTVTRFDNHMIEAWCEYLPCQIGELIEVVGTTSFYENTEPGQMVAARAG